MKDEGHISRTLTRIQTNPEIIYSHDSEELVLEDQIFHSDKIILLGVPGIGKSKELNNLFFKLWDRKEELGLYPFFVNLKLFRKAHSNFEELLDYINPEWDRTNRKILILDGLDEVEEISDFLSALSLFIYKHDGKDIKYVISCRTNIFNKYNINLPNFEIFVLNDLSIDQTKDLLTRYDIRIREEDIHKYSYFQNPFFLNLAAKYIEAKGSLPNNDLELWEEYIRLSLKNDIKVKFEKKQQIDEFQLRKMLRKTALVNELMHRNYNKEDELFEILGTNWNLFVENPFYRFDNKNGTWSFVHRQIQEYFVASSLLNMDLSSILSIVCIEGTDKIHPNMFNSVSFLLNIITNENSKNEIVDWLKRNQVEVLINADASRITENIRKEVFQDYFTQQCIIKKLW